MVLVGFLAVLGAGAYFGFTRYRERAKQAAEERDQAEKKLLPTSTYDATADIVDEDFRLRLKWPGKGFKMLRQEDARRVFHDTLAGIVHEKGCQLLVVGDYSPGADLAAVAKAGQQTIPGTHVRDSEITATQVLGRPAARFEVETNASGLNFHHEHVVIERDGWFLRFGRINQVGAQCTPPRVEDVVVLEEGTVRGRNLTGFTQDHERPQYRVRGSTLESVVHRLRVSAPEGSGLLVGSAVALTDREAAALIASMGVSLFISTSPAPPISVETYTTEWVNGAAGLYGGTAEKATVPASGGRPPLTASIVPGPAPYESLYAFEVIDGRLVVYRAVYATKLRPDALEHVKQTRASVHVLSEAEAASLSSELPSVDPTRKVGPDRALRSGKLVHYTAGFTLPLPPSSYQPQVVDGRGEEIVVNVPRPTWGVDTTVIVSPRATDLASAQRAVAAKLIEVPEADLAVTAAPAVGKHTRGRIDYIAGGAPSVVDVVSVAGHAHTIHIATSGPTAWVDAAEPETRSLIEKLTVSSTPSADSSIGDRVVRNDRLGFELALPAASWSVQTIQLAPNQWFVTYGIKSDLGDVFIFAAGLDDAEADFTADVIEQQLVAKFVQGTDVPERTQATLGGAPAKRIAFSSKIDAIVSSSGGTLFFIVVESKVGKTLDPVKVYDGFRLLD